MTLPAFRPGSLLDTFAPSLVELGGSKRTHRIGKPEELTEDTVPRKATPVAPADLADAVARKPRKKRKYTRRAKPVERTNGAEPTFIVDDAGRVAILDGEQRIDLSAGATKRLTAFLEKHA